MAAVKKSSARRAAAGHRRYALLLRGVNVGTRNSLPMADLRSMLEAAGCTEVATYVQSGNAVFTTDRPEASLATAIEAALERYMGRPISTTLRTREELAAVVAGNPFGKVADNPSRLCVTFLSHPPSTDEVAPLHAREWSPEQVQVSGREIYTWHPDGQGQSALAQTLGKLRVRGALTTRNWNTVQKLLELLGDG